MQTSCQTRGSTAKLALLCTIALHLAAFEHAGRASFLVLAVAPLAVGPVSLRVAVVTFALLGPGGALGLFWLARREPAPPPLVAASLPADAPAVEPAPVVPDPTPG